MTVTGIEGFTYNQRKSSVELFVRAYGEENLKLIEEVYDGLAKKIRDEARVKTHVPIFIDRCVLGKLIDLLGEPLIPLPLNPIRE